MGRSCFGFQENISTGQIILFCSHGEMFSRLPGKVSRYYVDFVKCKQKVFPLSRKVEELSRDVACEQARSRYLEKLSSQYECKATFYIISYQGKISLVNLSEFFLGNRDNFCPYEQALTHLQINSLK